MFLATWMWTEAFQPPVCRWMSRENHWMNTRTCWFRRHGFPGPSNQLRYFELRGKVVSLSRRSKINKSTSVVLPTFDLAFPKTITSNSSRVLPSTWFNWERLRSSCIPLKFIISAVLFMCVLYWSLLSHRSCAEMEPFRRSPAVDLKELLLLSLIVVVALAVVN
jgi:uncharacterized membrane protein YwzB